MHFCHDKPKFCHDQKKLLSWQTNCVMRKTCLSWQKHLLSRKNNCHDKTCLPSMGRLIFWSSSSPIFVGVLGPIDADENWWAWKLKLSLKTHTPSLDISQLTAPKRSAAKPQPTSLQLFSESVTSHCQKALRRIQLSYEYSQKNITSDCNFYEHA